MCVCVGVCVPVCVCMCACIPVLMTNSGRVIMSEFRIAKRKQAPRILCLMNTAIFVIFNIELLFS